MQNLSKQERRELRRKRRKEKREIVESSRNRIDVKRYALISMVIISLSFLIFIITASPGQADGFATCLSEKGVVVYGNDWCRYTQEQLSAFGNSAAHLNYVRCDQDKQLCSQKGVSITPTWEISGKTYAGIQSFETLSRLSGCGT